MGRSSALAQWLRSARSSVNQFDARRRRVPANRRPLSLNSPGHAARCGSLRLARLNLPTFTYKTRTKFRNSDGPAVLCALHPLPLDG